MNFVNKRIKRDIESLKQKTSLKIISDRTIHCTIKGTDDTPYVNGIWNIVITFPEEYPFKSPSIGFIDKIWHPNIDFVSGSICLDVLNTNWSPIYTLTHIIEVFIPQLLTYPNPEDPLNVDCAEQYLNDNEVFNKRAALTGTFID